MPTSKPQTPLTTRIFKIAIAIVVPIVFLSFTIYPILQTLSGNSHGTESPDQQLMAERLQREIEGYEEVLSREPDNIVALQGLIDLYFQQGSYEKAIDPLSHLAELQPEDDSLPMLLGSLLLQSGRGEEAVEVFEPLYAKQPNSPVVLDGLVRSYLLADRTDTAAELLTEQLEESPEDRELQMQLARVYRQSGQEGEALEIYDRMIAEDPEDFVPLLEKAVALSQGAGEDVEQEEIEALFDQAISLAPEEQQPQVEQLKTLYGQLGSVNSINEDLQEEDSSAETSEDLEESTLDASEEQQTEPAGQ